MKNKNIILGYQVEIKIEGEKYYTEYQGFYTTKEQAQARLTTMPLLQGDKARIKTVYAI